MVTIWNSQSASPVREMKADDLVALDGIALAKDK